jgi:hypothetical protein
VISRRELLLGSGALLIGSRGLAADGEPIRLTAGPHLFLDEFLIASQRGLTRVVHPPRRLPAPILSSARYGVTQPYLGFVRDPETDRLRLWYNRGNEIWHAESTDGVAWGEPRVAWALKRCYGVSIVDDGPREPDPQRRFKLANWQATRELEDGPRDNGGMYVGFSPDGFRWTAHPGNPVLPTWPAGYGKPTHEGVGDIVDAFYDPVHRRYGCAVKLHAIPGDGFPKGTRANDLHMRRWVGMTTSQDFVRWEKPWQIAVADERDEGLTEFYGMAGVHARGPLLIGFARVLRDDLPCDPGGPPDGIGWSVLMTSRDGRRWERDRTPFLDRSPAPGWDHAMAWMSGVIPVGDELFLYYGGYARGHKVEPQKERQIGLAQMKRDRYASRTAGREEGILLTPPLILDCDRLTVNANVRGELRVRILDPEGRAVREFEGGIPLTGDSLAHSPRWRGRLSALRGRPIRLELRLREADLFSLDLA